MDIAIIGYGRMGREVEAAALERGHRVVCRIDSGEEDKYLSPEFRSAGAAIEFTAPAAAEANVRRCMEAGVPVVSGTTGWPEGLGRVRRLCDDGAGTVLWASNFSVGVNIFMAVNRYMARLMDRYPQYGCSIEEVHHVHKLDHPSGTAVTLAETIEGQTGRLHGWAEPDSAGHTALGLIPVAHRREGEVPGIHTVRWESDADTLTFTHSAKGRRGFALGAVLAAEWLAGGDRKGWHTAADMFGF